MGRCSVIGIELCDPGRFATREYRRLYHALADVDEALHQLRELLPVPGTVVDEQLTERITDAEREVIATWIRYLHAYDAMHAR